MNKIVIKTVEELISFIRKNEMELIVESIDGVILVYDKEESILGIYAGSEAKNLIALMNLL